jgi:putative nucleotidyltransferase with HDIG domain
MNSAKIPFFKSFQAKVMLALVLSILFVSCLSNLLVHKFSYDAQFNQLREKLKVIAQTAALAIDTDALSQVPLKQEGTQTVAFKTVAEKLSQIKKANPPIKFIYTLTKTETPGIWQFVVDADPPFPEDIEMGITSYPGDKYDASHFPEMLKAFDGPAADTKLEADDWGATLSGYAPVRDKNGKAIAVLGVDFSADEVYLAKRGLYKRAILVFVLGVIVSTILGVLVSQRITDPISELVKATRNIAEGNLNYQVKIKGTDEIGQLAASFNQMGKSLFELRNKLLNYFFRVAQSLVRVLEAKDQYTRGHSERVAEYAEKIARRMGFSADKIELLKEAAMLHDIGKIGIKESILNKSGKLTEEEWETVRKHPIVGENIVRPISVLEEMMTIIRGHHERYDGEGYPDKISGENIHIFASIVSVADAYDAMTSPRAYRLALNKQKAIAELKRNIGTQFRPKIIEAFLEILEKET